MCGISGIFSYQDDLVKVNKEHIINFNSYLSHRGPDDSSYWISNTSEIGLGHTRLSIIDLSQAASQPMEDNTNGNRITFNGEIYNYKELRDQLILDGFAFNSNSDTEVLLKLYSKYKFDMLEKIRGMFAFAIWDCKENAIFLSRDPFGIKPIYYFDNDKYFIFASESKALISCNLINKEIENAGIVGFHLWGSIPEPYTMYKNVFLLEAGNYLYLKKNKTKTIKRYFSVTNEILKIKNNNSKINQKEIIDYTIDQLTETVKLHSISDVPVGIFQSGGLDSSFISSILSDNKKSHKYNFQTIDKLNKFTPSTLTLGFKEFKNSLNDETVLAKKVSDNINSKHYIEWIGIKDFNENFSNLLLSMDQPTINGINSYFISKMAKKNKFKVAISGLGGDEIFGGYSSFNILPKIVKLVKYFSFVPSLNNILNSLLQNLNFLTPKKKNILNYSSSIEDSYFLYRGLFMPSELNEIIGHKDLIEAFEKLTTFDELKNELNTLDDDFLKIMVLEITCYMKNQLLRDIDWASMAHSVEVRVPYVDQNFFKTIILLNNNELKVSKKLIFENLNTNLPVELINKRKTGFSTPVYSWIGRLNDNKYNSKTWARKVINEFI